MEISGNPFSLSIQICVHLASRGRLCDVTLLLWKLHYFCNILRGFIIFAKKSVSSVKPDIVYHELLWYTSI